MQPRRELQAGPQTCRRRRPGRKGSGYGLTFLSIDAGLTANAHFESGLMPADRLLTSLGSLVERGKQVRGPVSRSALGVALGGLDREITQTLGVPGRDPGTRSGLSTGRILHNLVERSKPVPRPALGVVLGGYWGMGGIGV